MLLVNLFLSGVFVFVFLYETTRWFQITRLCDKLEIENYNLINSENCRHAVLHKEEMQKLCKSALLELERSLFECKIQNFWKESGYYHLYQMFTGSYWMLFGITVTTILYCIHKMFDSCRQKREEERQDQIFDKILDIKQAGEAAPRTNQMLFLEAKGEEEKENQRYFSENFKKRKIYIENLKN